MPVLYVTEFSAMATDSWPIPKEPPNAEQTVAITGSPVSSSVFSTGTRLLRVHTDSICSVEIGASPSAAITNRRLAANQTEYFGVEPGQAISVISNV